MSARRQIHAAIFDMDGLLIDSEPLWDKAELEVMASLGVDISRRHEMPDILGLRIDLVVDLWFAQQPWKGPDRAEVTARIINRAIQLVEEARPLLPGAREAVAMCKAQGLKIGWRRLRRCGCWKKSSPCLNCAINLTPSLPPKGCRSANRTRRSIWTAPPDSASARCSAWRWKTRLTA